MLKPFRASLTADAFLAQVENGLENIFFVHFSPVSILGCGQDHTDGYAVLQVKRQRDIYLKLSNYF